jgi:streptogramin lyase
MHENVVLALGVSFVMVLGCGNDGRPSDDGASTGITDADDEAVDVDDDAEGSGSTASTNDTDADGSTSTADGSTSTADDDPDEGGIMTKWDLGTLPDSAQGCAGGDGGIDTDLLSFIWIANSSQGTVSKINTMTGVEEGRYDSSPAADGNPSRTSVNLLGDVAVSNRHTGGVTKIAAHLENCVDKNNNGMIETSNGPGNVLPWDQDECVLWHTPTPTSSYGNGPRPTAWEGGKFSEEDNCSIDDNPRLWIGFKRDDSTGEFWRIDGATGDVLDMVNVGYWGSSYGPYGGAVNAEGDLVVTGLNTDPSKHIDSETLAVTDLGNPGTNCKYGMALDQNGDLWVGHCFGEGVSTYSFETNQWTTIPNAGGTRVNGIQADRDGNVWGAGSNPCRLVQIDVETKQYINPNIPLPGDCSSPWGVSVDVEGFVWIVDKGSSTAYKVDPETYQTVVTVSGLVGPYTYSDMTGSGLNLVVNPPG